MINFKTYLDEGKRGLWDNIHAKRERIKNGSGERMRKPGSKGAPTEADFKAANEEAEHNMAEGKLATAAALAGAIALGGAMGYKHATKDPNAEPTIKTKYERNAEVGAKLKKKILGHQKESFQESSEDVVIEAKEDKIKQLKADHATAMHWSKNETSPQKREAARQKAEKIKNHLETQYKQDVNEELSADEQFDLIEETVEELAKEHSLDSEAIWEALESVDDIELLEYAIDKKGHKSSTGGLTQKGVDAYNRESGGHLQMAVTTKPSKLKPGSKAANRRKSFCARMGGVKGPMKDDKGRPTRKALALKKWNC